MKKLLFFGLLFFSILFVSAQEERKTYLYKGFVDTRPVTMYLVETTNQCPSTYFTAMYKYDKVNNWLLLDITDLDDKKFMMVEHELTGVLSVSRSGNQINGVWMSPDGKRVLKVSLKEAGFTSKDRETYENKLDQIMYDYHDC